MSGWQRTRRQRIETLERRLAWLRDKSSRRAALGDPVSFLREEIEALEWALPILEAEAAQPHERARRADTDAS